MAFKYLQSKGLGRGHQRKSQKERVLTEVQFRAVLDACEASQYELNEHWKRDYSAIYLSFMLGMRISEAIVYERKHCRELLAGGDTVYVPTLKQGEKLPYRCLNPECLKKVRVRFDKAGKQYRCTKCGVVGVVQAAKKDLMTGVVERNPEFVEEATQAYLLDYINGCMRPDQRWFFEGRNRGYHISASYLSRIFNTFTARAGLSGKYSFHSLRHGRGVILYSQTHELEAVRMGLRHTSQKTTEIYIGLDAECAQKYKKELNKVAFDPLKKKK